MKPFAQDEGKELVDKTKLNVLLKLFNRNDWLLFNIRLENFLFKRNIIRPEQIGFCKNKRTSDHMFVLKTLIEKYTRNNPKVLFSCFIDLRKAFDKVRHDGLLYKLRKNGISDLFYNIIKNMYQKTELCVKTDRSNVTDSFSSNIGVRQGDNLTPNLFKLFITEILYPDCRFR
jgi:hypothetical protein